MSTKAAGNVCAIPKKRNREQPQSAHAVDGLPAVPRKRSATISASPAPISPGKIHRPAAAPPEDVKCLPAVGVRKSDISISSGSTTSDSGYRPFVVPTTRQCRPPSKAATVTASFKPVPPSKSVSPKPVLSTSASSKSLPSPLSRQPPVKLSAAVLRQFVGRPAATAGLPVCGGVVAKPAFNGQTKPAKPVPVVPPKPPVRKIAGVPQPQAPTLCISTLVANVAAKGRQQPLAAAGVSRLRQRPRPYDLDEADESDLDFIDDGDDGSCGPANWVRQLRAVTGYDPTKFVGVTGEAAETSVAEQQREELRSARIACREDAEELQKLHGGASS